MKDSGSANAEDFAATGNKRSSGCRTSGWEAVDLLAEAAGRGPVLDLGVGTSQLAVPLAKRGIDVHGIDASASMAARLRAKPGANHITIIVGDLRDPLPKGPYSLVYAVNSILYSLQAQDDQVRCFRNLRERIAPGGAFVLHAAVPDLGRYVRNQCVDVQWIDENQSDLVLATINRVDQRIFTQHVVMSRGHVDFFPSAIRYAWPSELDLMAELTRWRLKHRWSGWGKQPFSPASHEHISMYEAVP